jgi:hypothetical protein
VILRPARLAGALAAGEVSEREKFLYLLVWAVVGILVPSRVGGWAGWSSVRVALVVVSLLITIGGLLVCFQANARGDNRAFLERYLCLSVPLGFMTYVLYYAIYYGLGLAGATIGWVESDARNWDRDLMSLISSMSALSLFFLWMRASIVRAARVRAA